MPILIGIIALVAGALALLVTPREEEPQIVVPSADILIESPSLDARQVERLVATPLEKLLAQIDGVEHVYSVSSSGRAAVTVSFYVGEDREDSLLKLYSKVYSNQDFIPRAVTGWVVKPIEVDDVPIVTATLWSDDGVTGTYELRRLAEEISIVLQALPQTNRVEVIGGPPRELQILLEPLAMVGRNTSVDDVMAALERSNIRGVSGSIDRNNTRFAIELDARVRTAQDLRELTVNVVDGVSVKLGDIAHVKDGPAEPDNYTWLRFAANHPAHSAATYPAVNIAVAKQKGANAVAVANDVLAELATLKTTLIPDGVHVEITRDYGATANDKMSSLISSLGVAVVIVVVLIGLILGWRSALVVALAVPICYGITLLLGYAAGYTINRVTLFALILAIGLLVDDPITGVDNMQRHMHGSDDKRSAIVRAFLEIRLPLLMSTIAIVIVFTPMSFITGMMGPYMSPMAFNVPTAVVVSTVVAFLVTPWLGLKLLRPTNAEVAHTADIGRHGLYAKVLRQLLNNRRMAIGFLWFLGFLFVFAMLLPMLRMVPLKLLPYDNKNEFQIVIDADEGSTLEKTNAIAVDLADYLVGVAEVRAVNAFVGVHAPMDFNGLIRRYYLRSEAKNAQLHVVLADKLARPGQSHDLILRLRPAIHEISDRHAANVKVVEVPPGPPVIASVVAEHYGSPTTPYADLIEASRQTAARLTLEQGVVDVDISSERDHLRLVYQPDQEKAALSGVGADTIARSLDVLAEGAVLGNVAEPPELTPLPIRLKVPYGERANLDALFLKGEPGISKLRERGAIVEAPTPLVSLLELGVLREVANEQPIYHKDLRQVAYTFAEVAGRMPAAVIYDVDTDRDGGDGGREAERAVAERSYFDSGAGIAWSLPDDITVTWSGEGEWNITLRVFRDLGIAFGVALLGLFIVIRLQTGLSALAGIIMLAIPLTAIGIMPGFWLMNALTDHRVGDYADPVLFTATAMIGMIALAGIVVRNSLILIEFVQQARATGLSVDAALLEASRLRTRPVLLTAGTTLLGNIVITLDPIFAGLAWAIIFGVAASTVFTLFVVPLVYQMIYGNADE